MEAEKEVIIRKVKTPVDGFDSVKLQAIHPLDGSVLVTYINLNDKTTMGFLTNFRDVAHANEMLETPLTETEIELLKEEGNHGA